jgi:hypothetical protein
MSDYYDLDGNPIGWETWTSLRGEKILGCTSVANLNGENVAEVSTVWLGLNHQWGDGPPLIFETMVFGAAELGLDQWCERYSTKAQAVAGHERVVTMVTAAVQGGVMS